MSDKKNFNYGRPFSPDDETEQQLKQWPTPDLTAETSQRTNAFNIANVSRKSEHNKAHNADPDELSIKPLTANDIEEIRQAAYDEGFAEGKDDGFSKGYAEGREQGQQDGLAQGQAEGKKLGLADAEQELTQQRKQLTALLQQLQQPLLAVNEQVKQQLVALSLAMAKAVIAVEVQTNPKVILQAITDAVSALPLQSKNVAITLNPHDIAIIEQFYSTADIAANGWHLIASDQIAQGGCLVKSTLSSVDRSIEQRVQTSLAHFIELQQLAKEQDTKARANELAANPASDNVEASPNTQAPSAEQGIADSTADAVTASEPSELEKAPDQAYTEAEQSHQDADFSSQQPIDKE